MGVKLYDKASDVVAELVSNSYDADAKHVHIQIPLNGYLATRSGGSTTSKDRQIVIKDDGHGFSEKEANGFFLKVGSDRRRDKARGSLSKETRRPVMGRKGMGKLSAFGICKTVEVWSAAGTPGQESYPISHFILKYDEITADTDESYSPEPGDCDGKRSRTRGTTITLRDFLYKKIPDKDTFMRQMGRKFGIRADDLNIHVYDTVTGLSHKVTKLPIVLQEDTKIIVDDIPLEINSKRFHVRGWVGYAKRSYQNEEEAGVRIYVRGKLAATTRDFGRKSGFTGEFTIRTYLVGEIHADWLDDEEDLIASDRQNLLWSSEKCIALAEWGRNLLTKLGKKSAGPMRRKKFEAFKERSNLEQRAREVYGDTQVYVAALDVGEKLAGSFSEENLENKEYVSGLLEMILAIAPHKTIVDKLRKIADDGNGAAMHTIATILGDVKLAEAASMGQVANERINAIETVENRIDDKSPGLEMQKILENAPWLIDPQWTVLQANQTFNNFRKGFEKWYGNKTKKPICTSTDRKYGGMRPDFIMLGMGGNIEIVEIKRPGQVLGDEDYARMRNYIDEMESFKNANQSMKKSFPSSHLTLICDHIKLNLTTEDSYNKLVQEGRITRKTWVDLLNATKKTHEAFLQARRTAVGADWQSQIRAR